MKKRVTAIFLIVGCLSAMLSGCGTTESTPASTKTVSIVQVESQSYDVGINYTGIVQPKETNNHAFLTGGKIETIYVEKGDYVSAGDPLAKLDTTQLELSASMSANGAEIARNTISTLEESLKASQLALETAQLNLERCQALYEIGAAALVEVENMQLQLASQQATHIQLQNELANAQASVENSDLTQQQALQSLADATLTSDRDGIVMDILFQEGEVVGAGYPVVITKSEELMVKVGLSVEDYSRISKDCRVSINGTIEGTIDTIASYPDPDTRVYAVEIIFSDPELSAGDTVDVTIFTGQETGFSIPVESIFQVDGLDYVYVVNEENRVNRKQVILGQLDGSNVRVDGLEEDMRIIMAGAKLINENDIVSIVDGNVVISTPDQAAQGDES